MFRTIRISILLVILAYVSIGSWVTRARSTAWEEPLDVVIYPINADRSDRAALVEENLDIVLVGEKTAREINWLRN